MTCNPLTATARLSMFRKNQFNVAAFTNEGDVWIGRLFSGLLYHGFADGAAPSIVHVVVER